MATTIIISTKVNPALRWLRMFVFMVLLLSFFLRRELRDRRVVVSSMTFSFTDCLLQPRVSILAVEVPKVTAAEKFTFDVPPGRSFARLSNHAAPARLR